MSQSQGSEVVSGPGRVVWGHPTKLVPVMDMDTKKPKVKQDGTPAMQTVCGIAFAKQQFMNELWPVMTAEAAKGYPNGVPQNFSWKLDDGDGIDSNGKPFAEREGYAGNYVLTVASNTGFPPALFKFNPATGTYDTLGEADIKCGDWVSVALHFLLNIPQQRTHTPSLYVNPRGFELIGYDKAIVSAGINPMQAFGGRQHQLPPGVSATPISGAPAGQTPPGMGGGAPMQQQPPVYQPQPAPMQQQPPVYQPQPAPMQQQPPVYGQPATGYPPPATGFVDAAGNPGQQPPAYQPQPAPMQQQQPPAYGQPAPQYAPQQQPPGMMPPR